MMMSLFHIGLILSLIASSGRAPAARPGALTNQGSSASHELPPLVWTTNPKPWNPPSGVLPAEVVSKGQALLRAGLGDPRGGEYREFYSGFQVQVAPANYKWGAIPWVLKEERGWYFPAKDGIPEHAITVAGISCIPVRLGPKKDLDADVKAALALSEPTIRSGLFDPREFWKPSGILRGASRKNLTQTNRLPHLKS